MDDFSSLVIAGALVGLFLLGLMTTAFLSSPNSKGCGCKH